MGILQANPFPDIAALRADLAAEVLRNIVKDGWSVLNMSAGIADALTDQTGLSALGGAAYDGAGRYLHNTGGATLIPRALGTYIGDTSSRPEAAFDGVLVQGHAASHYRVTNGYCWIGKDYAGSPQAVTGVKVYATNSDGFQSPDGRTVTFSLKGSNGAPSYGGGTLIGSGTIADANSAVFSLLGLPNVTSYQSVWVEGSTGIGNDWNFAEVEFYTTAAPPNVAARSISFVPAAPATSVRLIGLWEAVDPAALNADCRLLASTDGGASYAQVVLSDLGKFDASTRIVGGVVALPAGSAIRWGWDTLNAKTQRLRGVWMQWR